MSEWVVAVESHNVRVEFVRCGDRYAHRIVALGDACDSALCLVSREGDADQAVPPSPAYREIHEHTVGNAGSVLGVGMSGTNHWSLAVDVEPGGHVLFDVACRRKSVAPTLLFCSYALGPGWSIQQLEPHAVWLHANAPDRTMVLEWIAEPGIAGEEPGKGDRPVGRWEPWDTGLRLVVVPPGDEAGKATVRWRYRMRDCMRRPA